MNIKLLKSFAVMGFTFKVEEDGSVQAWNKSGTELKEGEDYIVEEKDKKYPISIEQSNGLTAYIPT